MIKGKAGEWYQDKYVGGYFAEDGHLVVCEEYGLADADTDSMLWKSKMERDIMTMMENIEVMKKNNCVKEKCRFYDDVSECAMDCCMYDASAED